jgi:hypothetical protein
MDYRAARVAMQLFEAGGKGVESLQKNPALMQIILDMHRAQGVAATPEAIIQTMSEKPTEDEDGGTGS